MFLATSMYFINIKCLWSRVLHMEYFLYARLDEGKRKDWLLECIGHPLYLSTPVSTFLYKNKNSPKDMAMRSPTEDVTSQMLEV